MTPAGAVYTMNNDPVGNQVVIFNRAANGTLALLGTVPTGGNGTGAAPANATAGIDPLGSQGSLMLTASGKWLLACNAGSNDISVFNVTATNLTYTGKFSSGGAMPVSIAIYNQTVYVLNGGAAPNITGFNLSATGQLTAIANSTRTLPAGAFGQVAFDRTGNWLVITDKINNQLMVYAMTAGLPAASPLTSTSSGTTPFGVAFDTQDNLLVVEAGNNSVSSYTVTATGVLQPISASVPNNQTAACWIVFNQNGFAYTANAGSGTISSYRIDNTGAVTLANGTVATANSPIDMSFTASGTYLYALDPKNGGIDAFTVNADGSLTNMGAAAGGLAIYAQGCAAW